jgi:hypothetical protein
LLLDLRITEVEEHLSFFLDDVDKNLGSIFAHLVWADQFIPEHELAIACTVAQPCINAVGVAISENRDADADLVK